MKEIKSVWWQGLSESEVHFDQILKVAGIGRAARRTYCFVPKGRGTSELEK